MQKGRFRYCFHGGSVVLFTSVLGTSWCEKYWQFVLVQGIASGIGMGMIFGPGCQVLVTYFNRRVGLATAIASSGGSVGGMIFPAMADRLISRVGFGWTMRGM